MGFKWPHHEGIYAKTFLNTAESHFVFYNLTVILKMAKLLQNKWIKRKPKSVILYISLIFNTTVWRHSEGNQGFSRLVEGMESLPGSELNILFFLLHVLSVLHYLILYVCFNFEKIISIHKMFEIVVRTSNSAYTMSRSIPRVKRIYVFSF